MKTIPTKVNRQINDWIVDAVEDGGEFKEIFDDWVGRWGYRVDQPDDAGDEDAVNDYILGTYYASAGVLNMKWALPRAESPIEKIFLAHVIMRFWQHDPLCLMPPDEVVFGSIASMAEELGDRVAEGMVEVLADLGAMESMCFVPQVEFSEWVEKTKPFPDGDVRADRLSRMRVDLVLARPSVDREYLIVECDGYEWHKGNFTEDRQRDRILRAAGLDVLRFSGSEIVGNCQRCADDLLQYALAKWGDSWRDPSTP